jgi:hypothetical protein
MPFQSRSYELGWPRRRKSERLQRPQALAIAEPKRAPFFGTIEGNYQHSAWTKTLNACIEGAFGIGLIKPRSEYDITKY